MFLYLAALRDLVLSPGIEPGPPAPEAQPSEKFREFQTESVSFDILELNHPDSLGRVATVLLKPRQGWGPLTCDDPTLCPLSPMPRCVKYTFPVGKLEDRTPTAQRAYGPKEPGRRPQVKRALVSTPGSPVGTSPGSGRHSTWLCAEGSRPRGPASVEELALQPAPSVCFCGMERSVRQQVGHRTRVCFPIGTF